MLRVPIKPILQLAKVLMGALHFMSEVFAMTLVFLFVVPS